MSEPFGFLVVLTLVAAATSVLVAVLALRRRHVPGVTAFSAMMFASAFWCAASAAELLAESQTGKVFWGKAAYVGIVVVAPSWLLFCLGYTGKLPAGVAWRAALLFVVPCITLVFALLGVDVGLVWSSTRVVSVHGMDVLAVIHGPWFWVHTAYSYACLLMGAAILLTTVLTQVKPLTGQGITIVLAVVAPWLANALTLTFAGVFRGVDLTPPSIVLSGVLLTVGLSRFGALVMFPGMVPVARDAVLRGMRDGVLVVGRDGVILNANEAAARWLDLDAGARSGRIAADLIPGLERARAAAEEEGTIQHEYVFETALRSACGDERFVEIVVSRLGLDKEAPGAVMAMRDVTERKRAEVALRHSEGQLRALVDNVPDIVFQIDRDYRLVIANERQVQAAIATQGKAIEIGESMLGADFPEEMARTWRGHFDRALAGESFVVNRSYPSPDGMHHLEDYFSPVRENGGVVTGVVVTSRDVTSRARAEEEIRRLNAELEERVVARTVQLEATNKELEAFAYSVSHDLRAPLRAIDGFSQMVVEDAGDKLTKADLEHLQRVRSGAQRMASLIDELLGLSRVSRMDLLREDVDLSALASEIITELYEAEPERAVECVVTPGLHAQADEALLRVILANLLGNAWKFTAKHEAARIEVGVSDAGGEHVHYVRDDGAGFDPQFATHLFGAFQRMHSAEEFEGDGIGLATVQRLVTRHGGRVWAEAEVEKGATFYFTLPGPTASI